MINSDRPPERGEPTERTSIGRCIHCGTQNAPEAVRCAQCGGGLLTECPRCGETNSLGQASCVGCAAPLPSAAFAGGVPVSGERRQLSVLFADLEGSSKLAESVDPEELHEILADFHGACARVIEQHHGYVAQYLGDGVLAYFGFPVAHEDDAARAVAASLAIHAALERLNANGARMLHARVGIHTGPVVIGELGSGLRREKLAVGETVNLAARVQSAARQGTVVITGATRDLVSTVYELRPLGLHSFRGVSSPVALHEVTAERPDYGGVDFADRESLSPFLGRSAELRLLSDAWDAVKEGRGQSLLLLGEAGMGKSRHALEFRRSVAGQAHELIVCACSPYHRDTALYPVIKALEHRLKFASLPSPVERVEALKASLPDTTDPSVVPLLCSLLSLPPELCEPLPAFGPQKMHESSLAAVKEWIAARTREAPLLLILEDLHWADLSTVALVRLLATESLPRAMVLLTSRPTHGETWHEEKVHTLTVGPLPDAEIAQILSHLVPKFGLPPEIVQQIVERAEGVPLFAEELCKAVASRPSSIPPGSEQRSPSEPLPVPFTLQESVSTRLDKLGSHKTVAQLAAVIGREFRVDVLKAAHHSIFGRDSGGVTSALTAMLHASLAAKQSEEVYAFRHSLIQEAIYRSFGKSTRAHFHQHVARVLSSDFPDSFGNEPEVLASHFAQGELHREASHHYGAAGTRALMRSAYVEASSQFTRAIESLNLVPDSSERARHEVDLRAGLGFSLLVTRGFGAKEVETVYRGGLQLAEKMQDIPLRILYGIWAFHMLRGDSAETARLVPAHQRICATSQNPLELLVANACLGSRAFHRGRYAEAVAALSRATQLCDHESPGAQSAMLLHQYNFEGLLYAPMFLAWCHLFAGRIAKCKAGIENALALAEKSKHPYLICSGLGCAGPMMHDMREVEATLAHGQRLLAIGVEHGFPYWIGSALCLTGWAAAQQDPHGPGIDSLKQGLEILRQIGSNLTYPYYLSYLIEVHLAAGRPADALPVAEDAMRIGEDGLNVVVLPEIRRLRGEALTALGDTASAENDFRLAAATTRSEGAYLLALRATFSLVKLLSKQGRHAEGIAELHTALSLIDPSLDMEEVRTARAWLDGR